MTTTDVELGARPLDLIDDIFSDLSMLSVSIDEQDPPRELKLRVMDIGAMLGELRALLGLKKRSPMVAEITADIEQLIKDASPRPWRLQEGRRNGAAVRKIVDKRGALVSGELWINDANAALVLYLVNSGVSTKRPKLSTEREVVLVESCEEIEEAFRLLPGLIETADLVGGRHKAVEEARALLSRISAKEQDTNDG